MQASPSATAHNTFTHNTLQKSSPSMSLPVCSKLSLNSGMMREESTDLEVDAQGEVRVRISHIR